MPLLRYPQLSAAIIAGGKSRRFGSPKALAQLNNKSLIEYSIANARIISEKILLNYGEEEIFGDRNIPLVKDIFPDCGPIGGIHAILHHVVTEWVAVLPCDLPLLAPQVYQILFTFRKHDRPTVALSDHGIEPLVSIWPRVVRRHVEQHIKERNFKVHLVLKKMHAVEVCIPEQLTDYSPDIFLNVNRIEDLEKIKRILTTETEF